MGKGDASTNPLIKKAEETRVDMDHPLSEAFFAFYWLSRRRRVSAGGMGGSIDHLLSLQEMTDYYKVFKPKLDLQHFIKVVSAADEQYMELLIKKKQQQATAEKNKAKSKGRR